MHIYVKDWLYIVKLLHSPVVASSGGKGREAQLIGCPTQVTSSRSVIQLDSEKISRIVRCNETDRMIIIIFLLNLNDLPTLLSTIIHTCILVKIDENDRMDGISRCCPIPAWVYLAVVGMDVAADEMTPGTGRRVTTVGCWLARGAAVSWSPGQEVRQRSPQYSSHNTDIDKK